MPVRSIHKFLVFDWFYQIVFKFILLKRIYFQIKTTYLLAVISWLWFYVCIQTSKVTSVYQNSTWVETLYYICHMYVCNPVQLLTSFKPVNEHGVHVLSEQIFTSRQASKWKSVNHVEIWNYYITVKFLSWLVDQPLIVGIDILVWSMQWELQCNQTSKFKVDQLLTIHS